MCRDRVYVALASSVLLMPVAAVAQERLPRAFMVDPEHSHVGFRVRFMGLSSVKGEFGEFAGAFLLGDDPTRSSATVVIRTSSINTHARARDNHLRSPDWFDVAKHPSIVFQSTRIERKSDGFVAHGTLAMHGVTRSIALPFVQLHPPSKDAWGNDRLGFRSELRLSRRDYGIAGSAFWNSEFDPGRFAVADSVDIELEISATIPNTARWTVPRTDSLVRVVETNGAARMIADYLAVRDSAARPDANAVFVTAAKLHQRGKLGDAIQLYSWGADRFSDSPMRPMVLGLVGEAYLIEGKRAEAEQAFRRALAADALEPRSLEWLRWLQR